MHPIVIAKSKLKLVTSSYFLRRTCCIIIKSCILKLNASHNKLNYPSAHFQVFKQESADFCYICTSSTNNDRAHHSINKINTSEVWFVCRIIFIPCSCQGFIVKQRVVLHHLQTWVWLRLSELCPKLN